MSRDDQVPMHMPHRSACTLMGQLVTVAVRLRHHCHHHQLWPPIGRIHCVLSPLLGTQGHDATYTNLDNPPIYPTSYLGFFATAQRERRDRSDRKQVTR